MSQSKSELTDAQIDAVWQRMSGDTEWLRTFGYQQFAQAILDAAAPIQDSSAEQCADPIVERNVSLLRQRSTVGVQKYGTTLADNKLPLRAWLNHALEESLDQANYLQAAMAEIDSAAAPQVQAYRNDPVVQGMADCMDMVRQELIEAGVIGIDVAPMFIANAVVAKLGAMVRPMPDGDPRPLFDRKLADLEQRGYEVIGRILHKDGQYALFDSSCRWLEKAQYQRLMHEQNGSLFAAPVAQSDVIEGELTKIIKSGAEKSFPGFLDWIADHLVYVHKESNNVDYVQTLRLRASQIRTAIAAKAAPTPK